MQVRRIVAIAGILAAVLLSTGGIAGGHAEVRFRIPEDNQVVGGTVDHVDLQYWTPVETATIRVTGPDDSEIAVGETIVSARGFRASVDFDPLSESGVYRVDHTELSGDGDTQVGEFQFAYDPESPERIGSLVEEDSGPNWLLLAAIAVIVVGAAALLVPKRRRSSKAG